VITAVFGMPSVFISTWKKPSSRSALEKIFAPCKFVEMSCIRQGYLSGIVTEFSWRYSPQEHQLPLGFGTMGSGEAQGGEIGDNVVNFQLLKSGLCKTKLVGRKMMNTGRQGRAGGINEM
jgi:hypothetical protein